MKKGNRISNKDLAVFFISKAEKEGIVLEVFLFWNWIAFPASTLIRLCWTG